MIQCLNQSLRYHSSSFLQRKVLPSTLGLKTPLLSSYSTWTRHPDSGVRQSKTIKPNGIRFHTQFKYENTPPNDLPPYTMPLFPCSYTTDLAAPFKDAADLRPQRSNLLMNDLCGGNSASSSSGSSSGAPLLPANEPATALMRLAAAAALMLGASTTADPPSSSRLTSPRHCRRRGPARSRPPDCTSPSCGGLCCGLPLGLVLPSHVQAHG